MSLNRFRADPSNLRILIVSTQKTGNTWLQNLLGEIYSIPVVDMPGDQKWDAESLSACGRSWVCRQHFPISFELLCAIKDQNIFVITTVRHPGDTFVSYVNYLRWWRGGDAMPENKLLAGEKEPFGAKTYLFLRRYYPSIYSLSLNWINVGSELVRYEDLWSNPFEVLRRLVEKISLVHESKIYRAMLLCRPNWLKESGRIHKEFVKSGSPGQWTKDLPTEFIEYLKTHEPFRCAAVAHGYSWDPTVAVSEYNYSSIDPFRCNNQFESGIICTEFLYRLYMDRFFPDSPFSGGVLGVGIDSYWAWLEGPWDEGVSEKRNDVIICNYLGYIYSIRDDLRESFPDLSGKDRVRYVQWFLTQGVLEYDVPWELVAKMNESYLDTIKRTLNSSEEHGGYSEMPVLRAASLITTVETLSLLGGEISVGSNEFVRLRAKFLIKKRVHHGVIGFSLRSNNGAVVFGTNSVIAGIKNLSFEEGDLNFSIDFKPSLAPGTYLVCVGLAEIDEAGQAQGLMRLYDVARLQVVGPKVIGNGSYCDVNFSSVI